MRTSFRIYTICVIVEAAVAMIKTLPMLLEGSLLNDMPSRLAGAVRVMHRQPRTHRRTLKSEERVIHTLEAIWRGNEV